MASSAHDQQVQSETATSLGAFARLRRWLFQSPARSAPTSRASSFPRARVERDDDGPDERARTFESYTRVLKLELRGDVPCTDEELESIELLSAEVLHRVRLHGEVFASLPSASLRLLNLLAEPEPELLELSRVVNQDPAIAAAVLRVANAAASGPSAASVSTVREAIARLGTIEVGRVAGAVAARSLFSPRAKAEHGLFAERFRALHHTAVTCGAGAVLACMQLRRGASDRVYLGGMLTDVGKAVALSALASLIVEGDAPNTLASHVVDAVLARVHVELGSAAEQAWGLPEYLPLMYVLVHGPNVPDGPDATDTHIVRVVAGLLDMRAGASAAQIAALMHSLSALRITPLAVRALDRDLVALGERMRVVLGT